MAEVSEGEPGHAKLNHVRPAGKSPLNHAELNIVHGRNGLLVAPVAAKVAVLDIVTVPADFVKLRIT